MATLAGARADGALMHERIARIGGVLIPSYPGFDLISPAKIPAPPLLPSEETTDQWVARLATCYRTTCAHRYHVRSLFMLSKPREHKHFGLLLEAAQLLHACEIPPVAWVLFSFDVWPLTVNAHVPSPSFVFSPKRIQERHDWFEDSRGGYGKVQIKYGNQHIALISSWDGMWDDLLRSRPETRQEVAAVVERWFPGASFEQRVNSAKLEARRLQLEIDRQVIEGAVLWR